VSFLVFCRGGAATVPASDIDYRSRVMTWQQLIGQYELFEQYRRVRRHWRIEQYGHIEQYEPDWRFAASVGSCC